MKKSKLEMLRRERPILISLCLMCAVTVVVALRGAEKKLTPAKEVEAKPATNLFKVVWGTNLAPTFLTNGVTHATWAVPGFMVTTHIPSWLLATNWLTTTYLIPSTGLQSGPQVIPVLQKSSVTSNLVMGVSWFASGSTNQSTNTFVLQSIPVPEWSGADRVAQEQVTR